MYQNGQGVGQSDATAVKWFRKAADQGHAKAHCGLASMYAEGRGGLPQDFAEAVKLCRIAEAKGSEEATAIIDIMLKMQCEQQAATISPLRSSPPPSSISIGAHVELRGLQAKPELNGRRGVVVKFVASSERCRVQLDGIGDKAVSLRDDNLTVVSK